jgi:hypothetical protein
MSKIFTSRARESMTRLDKMSGAVVGIVELFKLGVEWVRSIRQKEPPKRYKDIFPDGPRTTPKPPEEWERPAVYSTDPFANVESVREAGQMRMGLPERDELN